MYYVFYSSVEPVKKTNIKLHVLCIICMVLNICNFIQRTEQVPVELDISAIEEYILLLLLCRCELLIDYLYRKTN